MYEFPLIEAYRPKTFSELIGVKDAKLIESLISKPMEMPNLLFYGPPGTGKTSCIKIVIDRLTPVDVLRLNGSDTTGVDTIRDKVFNYITSMSTVPGKPKIVWIEEADFLSANALAALRSMIEQYMKNARFLFTLNYLNKIPEEIRSRFSLFEFDRATNEDIFKRVKFICGQEKIIATDEVLTELVKRNNGDFRAIINTIQKLSSNPEKTITETNLSALSLKTEEIYNLILSRDWSNIRIVLSANRFDYTKLFVDLDEKFFQSDLDIAKKAELNDIIAKGLFEMSFSFDKALCSSAICYRIIKVI